MGMTLDEFEALLKAVAPSVFHMESEKAAPPYVVWHEYRRRYHRADNRVAEAMWRVQVDVYSRNRREPLAEALEAALDAAGVAFTRSKYWEPETRLARDLFDCEVI